MRLVQLSQVLKELRVSSAAGLSNDSTEMPVTRLPLKCREKEQHVDLRAKNTSSHLSSLAKQHQREVSCGEYELQRE